MISSRLAPIVALFYGNVYLYEHEHELALRKRGMRTCDNEPNLKLSEPELRRIHEDRDDHPSPSMQRQGRLNRKAYNEQIRREEFDDGWRTLGVGRVFDISSLASNPEYPSPALRFLVSLFYGNEKPLNKIISDSQIASEVIPCTGKVLHGCTTKEPILDTVIPEAGRQSPFKRQFNRIVSVPLSTLIQNCFNEKTLEKILVKDLELYNQLKESIPVLARRLKQWGREKDPNIAFWIRTNKATNAVIECPLKIGTILEALQKFYSNELLISDQELKALAAARKPSHLTQWVMQREAEEAAKGPHIDLEALLAGEE